MVSPFDLLPVPSGNPVTDAFIWAPVLTTMLAWTLCCIYEKVGNLFTCLFTEIITQMKKDNSVHNILLIHAYIKYIYAYIHAYIHTVHTVHTVHIYTYIAYILYITYMHPVHA